MTAKKRVAPGCCFNCGARCTKDSVDNHGVRYKGCPNCKINLTHVPLSRDALLASLRAELAEERRKREEAEHGIEEVDEPARLLTLALVDSERRREEAEGWQRTKAEWIDVAERTLKAMLATAERRERDLAAMREALEKLIALLPKCIKCDRPATRAHGRAVPRWCDEHADSSEAGWPPEYPRAVSLRAAIAALASVRAGAR